MCAYRPYRAMGIETFFALPYQRLAAAVPLAGVVVAEENPLTKRLLGGLLVERLVLRPVALRRQPSSRLQASDR